MSKQWNTEQAIKLCRKLEVIAPRFGAHIALTGGCLYKDGDRKDVDIMVYRIRQVQEVDKVGFFEAIKEALDIDWIDDFGWCNKATINGKDIDFFFPDEVGGDYGDEEAEEDIQWK